MSKPNKIEKTADITDPRNRFIQYCKNFPIDIYNIPRPLKSLGQEINDFSCVLMALTHLGISHHMEEYEVQPIGWLIGPHLLDIEKFEDYILDFCDEPIKSTLSMNPWLLITESPVQLAVAILRAKCMVGNPRESLFAKNILKNLGLNILVSKSSRKKRTENLPLRFYQNQPQVLASAVILYEHIIRDYLKSSYKSSHQKKEDIGTAFQYIFNKTLTDDLFMGERDKDLTSIALAFIHYETGAPYESLYKLYYRSKKEFKLSEILEQLDNITDNTREKQNKIKELKELYRKNHPIYLP